MNRFSVGVIALWLAGIFLAACVSQGNLAEFQIATDATFTSFETVDMTTGQFSGFDIDLMRAIASRAGFQVKFSNVAFITLIKSVASCQFDGGIAAIGITSPLQQQVHFSDPYLTVGQVVVVKKGNLTINGRDQLPGMAVGTQRGSASALAIQNIPGIRLAPYDSFEQAFQDLADGNIDAVVAGAPRAQSFVNIKANNLKIVGGEFADESYGIAICNQNGELLKKINAGLKAVKDDGTLNNLLQKWNIKGRVE